MSANGKRQAPVRNVGVRRIPRQSLLYTRVIPLMLILFGVATLVIVVFAMGLMLGIVPYK